MGDSRTISVDSRKWGPVPISGVVGRVVLVNHGLSFTALHTPRTYVTEGLAPADTRSDAYLVLALLMAGSIVALLVLALAGVTTSMIAHRRAPRAAALAGTTSPSETNPSAAATPPAAAALPAETAPPAEEAPLAEAAASDPAAPPAEAASPGRVGVGRDPATPQGATEGLAEA
jgi:hypothetical protein